MEQYPVLSVSEVWNSSVEYPAVSVVLEVEAGKIVRLYIEEIQGGTSKKEYIEPLFTNYDSTKLEEEEYKSVIDQ